MKVERVRAVNRVDSDGKCSVCEGGEGMRAGNTVDSSEKYLLRGLEPVTSCDRGRMPLQRQQ